MRLYSICDLHLSFTIKKPIDLLEKRWKKNVIKIEKY